MSKSSYPTQRELQGVFEIKVDERNGYETLWRKVHPSKWTRYGEEKRVECKANDGNGYCHVTFKGRKVKYHTIVYILANGSIPEELMVDHVSGDRVDNQLSNLRLVTNRENGGNMRFHREGRLVGCTYNKRTKSWLAQILINGKKIHLGLFNTEEGANQFYLKADKMHIDGFGPNFIQKMLRIKTKDSCSSKYRGVCWYKRVKKWTTQIKINNKLIHLGYYETELEAHTIYSKALELMDQFVDSAQFRKLLLKVI